MNDILIGSDKLLPTGKSINIQSDSHKSATVTTAITSPIMSQVPLGVGSNPVKQTMDTGDKNWVSGVRYILFEFVFINVWNEQTVNSNLLPIIKQRIFDQAKQSIFAKISVMNKSSLYKHIVNKISLQSYLQKYIPKKHVKYLTMFILSSHSLAVETWGYRGVLNVNRVCRYCKDDIEDEFHFILKCPIYQNFRSK